MILTFTGLSGVYDRTLFTHKGPIVKKPLQLLNGSNLRIQSFNEIEIESDPFLSSHVGKLISISGSPGARNDGEFIISKVIDSSHALVEASDFDTTDVSLTISSIVSLVNELKLRYNAHRTDTISHGSPDSFNSVSSPNAVDLPSAIILLNELKTKFLAHIILVSGTPPVHEAVDSKDFIFLPFSSNLESAFLLVNDLRKKFEAHRQDRDIHISSDNINRTTNLSVKMSKGSGPLIGPFSWIISDPRYGQYADDPSDVSVEVNGTLTGVDAVFGQLGAVVLTSKPNSSDHVTIDYDWISNPPTQFVQLNSPAFVLNQDGNHNLSGITQHKYRSRSYLADPRTFNQGLIRSAFQPLQVGWKYKALERAYTAVLNDPNSLLLNVPFNRVVFPVLEDNISEKTIKYDPVTLPQNAPDKWNYSGNGVLSLSPGAIELNIEDDSSIAGPTSLPPFFSHSIDTQYPSTISSAFRVRVSSYVPDGAFTGVGFGISDGYKVTFVGFVETDSTNLSSAIVRANDIKRYFNQHITNSGSHIPNDTSLFFGLNDATDKDSVIVLLNTLKDYYNEHIVKGPDSIHQSSDSFNLMTLEDLTSLSTINSIISFVNIFAGKFDSHRTQSGVHYYDDVINVIPKVQQFGILTSRGFLEDPDSWDSYASDFTDFRTYRLVLDQSGNASLYISGDSTPKITVNSLDLPIASSFNIKLDDFQQVFFGSIGDETTSISHWAFIRVNVNPISDNQIGSNKSVSYLPTSLPELYDPPWIKIGQGGFDRLVSSNLVVDSTSNVPVDQISDYGLTSGAYLGYLRLEPSLTERNSFIIDFQGSISYYTFSLDNKAAGVFLDDGTFSTHLLFLQLAPTPATVTGTSSQPFPVVTGDSIILSLADGSTRTITFPSSFTTAAQITNFINTNLGFIFGYDEGGKVRFTTPELGSEAKFVLIGGLALPKLGLQPGTYFGRDSNPEPKVSYFAANYPEYDTPNWIPSGSQTAKIFDRTLRIIDESVSDFRSYLLSNTLYTGPVLGSSIDWKLDARFRVINFTSGSSIQTGQFLKFSGLLINLDEGLGGKNVEFHLSQSLGGITYISILSFNPSTNSLDIKLEVPFNWNDGNVHSYNIFTNKLADLCTVFVDNVFLGSFTYSSLNSFVVGPAISFGSGSNPVSNLQLNDAKSEIEWHSIAVFRDSHISDPLASSRRYIGIYNGGDPSLLSSYYVHQIDWSLQHSYRIVRDSITALAVFVDNSDLPVISINYDSLKLPSSSASFFRELTNDRTHVSFGCFSPTELTRISFQSVKYSIGKITLTDGRIPTHQVLNQANVITSPEHLKSSTSHYHQGFTVYSGGTPLDDFLSNGELAFTQLGENTPPVPMTQDLESRGGFDRTLTPTKTLSDSSFLNSKGFLTSFENDLVNTISPSSIITSNDAEASLILLVNEIRSDYESHRVSTSFHVNPDTVNVISSPIATNLATAISLINNIKAEYNSHLSQGSVHVHNDAEHVVATADAIDLSSAIALANDVKNSYESHRLTSDFHLVADINSFVSSPQAYDLQSCIQILNDLKAEYNSHRLTSGLHSSPSTDTTNVVTSADAIDLSTALSLAVDFKTQFNAHRGTGPSTLPNPPNLHLLKDFANEIISVITLTSTLDELIIFCNESKLKYNSHRIISGIHLTFDIINYVESPSLLLLQVNISLVNDIRAEYESHRVDPFFHKVTDTINSISAPIATDLVTAIALANDVKTKFNSHFGNGTYHQTPDSLNVITSSSASDIESLTILIQELKSKYAIHQLQKGVHGIDDVFNIVTSSDAVDLTSSQTLLNDIKSKYNAHLLQMGVHLSNDTIDPVVTANAVDLTTAINLFESLQHAFNIHRISTNFHVIGDTQNSISQSPFDVATIVTASNELKLKFNTHRVNIQSGYHSHGSYDNVHTVFVASPFAQLISVYEDSKVKFNNHRLNAQLGVSSHVIDDRVNAVTGNATYSLSTPEAYDLESIFDSLNRFKFSFNSHLSSSVYHRSHDVVNTITSPDATTISTAFNLMNELKSDFNAHIVGDSYHLVDDTSNFISADSVQDPTTQLYVYLNQLLEKYNAHIVRRESHDILDDDDSVDLEPLSEDPPYLISDAVILINTLKSKFNEHRVYPGAHVTPDVVNVISTVDATDLQSAAILANDFSAKFNAHLIQSGVHGSLVFIRLTPPDRVLYENMKFFVQYDGIAGLASSFSDDETLYMSSSFTPPDDSYTDMVSNDSANKLPFLVGPPRTAPPARVFPALYNTAHYFPKLNSSYYGLVKTKPYARGVLLNTTTMVSSFILY